MDYSSCCGLPRCCITINQNETLVLAGCADQQMIHGPELCIFRPNMCCYSWRIYKKVELFVNEYVLVRNTLNPKEDRYEFGPLMVELMSPWEIIQNPTAANIGKAVSMELISQEEANALVASEHGNLSSSNIILDSDEYLIKADKKGIKTIVKGPIAFRPTFGDTWGAKRKSISVPMNKYIVVHNSNSDEEPVVHMEGPMQYFPESFEEVRYI
jgi:hypothetical protein